MTIDAYSWWALRKTIEMILGDFIVRGGWDVLRVLDGALVEAHDWARHPLLRELGRLGREVEAFLNLVAAEVRT